MNSQIIDEAVAKVCEDIAPITDCRSNAEYRAYVSQILIKRLIRNAMDRLGGE